MGVADDFGHRIRSWSARITAASMLAVLAACTTFGEPLVSTRPGEASSFEGLAQLAIDDGPTALDILLVHGMCTHDAGWAESAIEQVATLLGANRQPVITRLPVPQSSAEVFGADLATPQWEARVAAIVWSPVVAPTKAELCGDTRSRSPACRRDAGDRSAWAITPASHALKDKLIDDCMADAVIYLGRARDPINDQMQKALVTAARHFEARRGNATAVTRPLVIITQSLGGKLAFDALLRMQQDYSLSHVGNRLAERTTRVYLAANQLPFLDLGDATLGEETSEAGTTAGPASRRQLMWLFEAAEARSAAAPRPMPGGQPARGSHGTAPRRATAGPADTAAPASPAAAVGRTRPASPIRIAGMPGPLYAADPVEQFIRSQASQPRLVQSHGRPLPPLQVVAFNDPHDLMAYGVSPVRRAESEIIDVTLEIEPAALGIVVPPDPAHLNYLRDARVRELILCGYRQASCPTEQAGAQTDAQTGARADTQAGAWTDGRTDGQPAEQATGSRPSVAPRPPPSIFGPR